MANGSTGISPPDLMLKIIWMVHFVLTVWASMDNYLPLPYFFCHLGVLAFGFWAIVSKESVEAVVMFWITLVFSVVNDIVLISIYEPRTHDYYEGQPTGFKNEHRFAVGMSIIHLIVKPVSLFLLFRVYQSRSTGTTFTLKTSFTNRFQSSPGQNPNSYSNIDSSQNSHPRTSGQNPQDGYQDIPHDTNTYQSTPPGYGNPPPSDPSEQESKTYGSKA